MMQNGLDPGDMQEPPPVQEFLAYLYLHRHGASWIFGTILALALIVAALLRPQYRATASLAVMPSPEYTVREDAGSHAFNNSALAMDQIMKAESEILESDDLHESTIAGFNLPGSTGVAGAGSSGVPALYPHLVSSNRSGKVAATIERAAAVILSPWRAAPPDTAHTALDAATRRFGDHLRVLPSKDSNVITVSFTHDDAEVSAGILNVMLTRYASQRRQVFNDPQLAVAQAQADEAGLRVRAADVALTTYKVKRGYSDYATERDLLLKRYSQARQSLADANTARMESQARLTVIQDEIRRLPVMTVLYRESDTDNRLLTMDDRLLDLRGKLDTAHEHYRDTSRMVVGLQTQIARREDERRQLAQDGTPSLVRSGRNLAIDTLMVDKVRAAADLESAIAQGLAIQAELQDLEASLAALGSDETNLADLVRRKQAADNSYVAASRAAAEQRLTEAEDARRLANVRIIQPARVPQHPTWTKPLVCIAGAFLALLSALMWVIAGFIRSDTLLTEAGLAYATGLPILAVFHTMRGRNRASGALRPHW